MTQKEFNEKYAPFTKEGFEKHGPLEFDEPGVTEFLDSIFQDLILIPGFKVSQIKLKFGSVRFYSNLKSNHLGYLIENKISKILNKE